MEKLTRRDISLLEEVYDQGEGVDTFWLSMHREEKNADKKAKRVNVALKKISVGPRADSHPARNYNMAGYEWGVVIHEMTDAEWDKLSDFLASLSKKSNKSLSEVIVSERRKGITE